MKPREKRKRDYIPFTERLAAALSMLLSADERDAMRAAKVPAKAVLKLFQWDHVALHSLGGSDCWRNLTPMQVKPHRQKSRGDTSAVAKVDRIIARQIEHEQNMKRTLRPTKRQKSETRWPPKRKILSRPMRSTSFR